MTLTRGCPECGRAGECHPNCAARRPQWITTVAAPDYRAAHPFHRLPAAEPRTYREAVALRAAEASAEAVQAWREGPGRHIARTWRHITRWDRVPIGGYPAAHLDPGTGCPYGGTCSTLPACRRRALERPNV